jgi:hypothetical protein
VLDTKFVGSVVDPKETMAPLTKLLPVMVRANAPTFTAEGVTPEICGMGFRRVTALLAFSDDFEVSAASIVIIFGDGSTAGAT